MEFKKENVIAAYNAASEELKKSFRLMFPEVDFEAETSQVDNRPITERVKTFEDACKVANVDIEKFNTEATGWEADIVAYMKLRVIAAALNEGWEPQFTEDEERWHPWFTLWTEEELADKSEEWKKEHALWLCGGFSLNGSSCGLAYAYSDFAWSLSHASDSARLAVKSEELATYFGKQFISIWADYVGPFNRKQETE